MQIKFVHTHSAYKRGQQKNIQHVFVSFVERENMVSPVFILCSVLLLSGTFIESRPEQKYDFHSKLQVFFSHDFFFAQNPLTI